MDLSIIMGFISSIGLSVGTRAMKGKSKTRGIIQLVLTFLAPILVILFCLEKDEFVFGGTDWEFLVHSATVDKMIIPWIILVIYISFIALTIYNIVKNRAIKE